MHVIRCMSSFYIWSVSICYLILVRLNAALCLYWKTSISGKLCDTDCWHCSHSQIWVMSKLKRAAKSMHFWTYPSHQSPKSNECSSYTVSQSFIIFTWCNFSVLKDLRGVLVSLAILFLAVVSLPRKIETTAGNIMSAFAGYKVRG